MKSKIIFIFFILGISSSLCAQTITDSTNSVDEKICTINISRSATWQEWNTKTSFSGLMIYINEKPVCELLCESRVSIKMYSEGKINITAKFIPNKNFNEKRIDKYLHYGTPLALEVSHGKTYFLNVDMKDKSIIKINSITTLVSIPESEVHFKDEKRFKKYPEIKECKEDISNPYIK